MPNYPTAISFVINWLISEITIEIKLDRVSPISLITIFMRRLLEIIIPFITKQVKIFNNLLTEAFVDTYDALV